uniref:Secreted protein n=1 Tax=Arundo donax TaxID=35708 RepID=A0A0A9GGV5_ARUDO
MVVVVMVVVAILVEFEVANLKFPASPRGKEGMRNNTFEEWKFPPILQQYKRRSKSKSKVSTTSTIISDSHLTVFLCS